MNLKDIALLFCNFNMFINNKKYVDQGMSFYIRDIDSKVYKHQIVSKRVPIKIEGMPHYNQSTPISLKVHNLEDYYGSEEYMSKFMSEE